MALLKKNVLNVSLETFVNLKTSEKIKLLLDINPKLNNKQLLSSQNFSNKLVLIMRKEENKIALLFSEIAKGNKERGLEIASELGLFTKEEIKNNYDNCIIIIIIIILICVVGCNKAY